jgi:hypothetical protein
MALKDKLTHKIDITPLDGQTKYGEPAFGTTNSEVACFIDGRYRRIAKGDGTLISIDYSILFLPDAEIGINYRVTNGIDASGTTLLTRGTIVGFEDSNHPSKGRVVREAFIEAN